MNSPLPAFPPSHMLATRPPPALVGGIAAAASIFAYLCLRSCSSRSSNSSNPDVAVGLHKIAEALSAHAEAVDRLAAAMQKREAPMRLAPVEGIDELAQELMKTPLTRHTHEAVAEDILANSWGKPQSLEDALMELAQDVAAAEARVVSPPHLLGPLSPLPDAVSPL